MPISSYHQAVRWLAEDSLNMPEPSTKPGEFIRWMEDCCGLVAYIYGRDFEEVQEDLYGLIGLELEED